MTGFDVEVGETFDPGPEFAYSEFKYERHPEISPGKIMGKNQWVHCASRLHAESKAYAAYPDGIPEGTHIGEFLGRQFMAMKKQLGFDYIWLSNGFGFALDAWNWTGELFNGERFDFSNAERIRDNIAEFWRYFTAETGDTVIETRGTNLSTGMDIASHGCPIDLIYSQNIISPPNSPWAAMDLRFGLEFSGYMSHIAEIPEKGFAFRFYSHDPWWMNSPWFDRYDRSPHDIYLPLCIARLDDKLSVTHPYSTDFLTADDSFGRVPAKGANEMTPHMLSAFEDYPDEAGLVTWVYPFDTYCKMGLRDGNMDRIIMDDWFIESAIDQGFPINTVISDKNFILCDKKGLTDTLLVTPVPEAGSELENAIFDALSKGARFILYGSCAFASDRIKKAVGVKLASNGLEGSLDIDCSLPLDRYETGKRSSKLEHIPLVSNGGVLEEEDGSAKVVCKVSAGGQTRAYATFNEKLGKGLAWIRGSFPHKPTKASLPTLRKMSESFIPSVLMRSAMSLFGFPLTYSCYNVDDKVPVLMLSKCRGAYYFNMYSKDSTIKFDMSTPFGAPAPDGCEFMVENSVGTYNTARWMHNDCRTFIKQDAKSKVLVKRDNIAAYVDIDERLDVTGVVNADVTFRASKGAKVRMKIYPADIGVWEVQPFKGPYLELEHDEENDTYTARNVTGKLVICSVSKEHIGDWKQYEFIRPID